MFTDAAIDRITAYAGGVPRLINTVCDHCLLFGYADQKRRIERNTVNRAIEYLEEGTRLPNHGRGLRRARSRFVTRWSVGTLVVMLTGVLTALAFKANLATLRIVESVRLFLVP
jgi:hypothetical protein